MVNIVLASSLRVINLSGQMSLAHGAMMTIGAYASALLVMKAGISSGWPCPSRASGPPSSPTSSVIPLSG